MNNYETNNNLIAPFDRDSSLIMGVHNLYQTKGRDLYNSRSVKLDLDDSNFENSICSSRAKEVNYYQLIEESIAGKHSNLGKAEIAHNLKNEENEQSARLRFPNNFENLSAKIDLLLELIKLKRTFLETLSIA